MTHRIGLARWPLALAVLFLTAAGCSQKAPPKRYPLKGQILAVDAQKQQLTIKHEDIPNFMPAMTMSYPVATPDLMQGRVPGELISAVLEVDDSMGRLVEITHTGAAPLPEGTNQLAMSEGLLAEGDDVPDAAFIDQNDHRRSFSEWRGSLTLLTFIYTSCPLPNYCPLMDQNFSTIQRAVSEDPQLKGQVKLVSVTFDPNHDTPAVLADHAKAHATDPAIWTFLTGDEATIDRFAGRFGVGIIRSSSTPEITHNLRTVLIGRDGKILKIYSGNDWTPGAAMTDMRAALRRS